MSILVFLWLTVKWVDVLALNWSAQSQDLCWEDTSSSDQREEPQELQDTFSRIPSVKIHSNFIFHQFCVFVYGTISKNKTVKFAESFRKFNLLYWWWIVVTVSAQLDHLILMFTYFFILRFFKQKIAQGNLVYPSENRYHLKFKMKWIVFK